MDYSQTSSLVGAAAVPTAGPGSGQLLLSSRAGVGGQSALHAIAGSGIYRSSLLRSAEDDGLVATAGACRGAQAGAAPAPCDGADGGVSEAAFEPQSIGLPALSVSVEGPGHRAPQPSLEHRHHLHPAAGWICFLGGDPGLVQPLCARLGTIDYVGSRLLCGGPGASVSDATPGDLQQRPGRAIHQRSVPGTVAGGPSALEHGWARPGIRQYLRGTALAQRQVRGGLPQGLPRRRRGPRRTPAVFSLLQREASSSSAGLSHAAQRAFRPPMNPEPAALCYRRGARAKAQSTPPCSFNSLITAKNPRKFHHLNNPETCLDNGEHLSSACKLRHASGQSSLTNSRLGLSCRA